MLEYCYPDATRPEVSLGHDFQGMPTRTLPPQKLWWLAKKKTNASPVKLFPRSPSCQQRKENSSKVGDHRLMDRVSVATVIEKATKILGPEGPFPLLRLQQKYECVWCRDFNLLLFRFKDMVVLFKSLEFPFHLEPTNPRPIAVLVEPFSKLQSSSVSLEYLLLPPRSAVKPVPPELTPFMASQLGNHNFF